jgi:methionyl aminopeptidase
LLAYLVNKFMSKIFYKTREEVELCRQAAQLVSKTLGMLASEVKPGANLKRLDDLADQFIRDHHAVPIFKGFHGFPGALCLSLNEAVVHGLPVNKELVDGDIISVDCGAKLNGFCGDHAYTFPVGEISAEKMKLLEVTLECLSLGIEQTKLNNRIGDIAFAVQDHAEKHGYGVVRELVGHGLGKNFHEKPDVPNYGKKGNGLRLQDGLVIAIEPMINMGTKSVKQLADGWTIVTADHKPSAHYEHNVAIIDGETHVLSTFRFVEEVLGDRSIKVREGISRY